jgi:hypothetical protein
MSSNEPLEGEIGIDRAIHIEWTSQVNQSDTMRSLETSSIMSMILIGRVAIGLVMIIVGPQRTDFRLLFSGTKRLDEESELISDYSFCLWR